MKKLIVLLFTFVLLFVSSAFAQGNDQETIAEVPALNKFHKVIYQIWHKFYPSKDYEGLAKTVPEVEKLAADIYISKLPGILREKQTKWDDGIAKLKVCVNDFKDMAKGKETQKLLDAAEKLHAQYEALVRVLKPVVKELDAFHQVMYVIYHKQYPDMKMDELKRSVPVLAAKRDTLMNASLPKPKVESPKYSERVQNFDKTKKELSAAVDELVKLMATNDKVKIKKQIELVHTKYQAVEKVFD